MRPRKMSALAVASLCLIFLTSSCATNPIAGFSYVEKGQAVSVDSQCIDENGAVDVAKKLEERRLCLEKLGRTPSFWDRFSSGVTIFGLGIVTGIIIPTP